MDDTTSPPQVVTSAADDAAREFRASLEQRREAIDTAAQSLEARQRSTTYADDIVRHAEALADRIESEARERAAQIVAEAEATRAALLDAVERARADLTGPPGPMPAASAGVDVLFGAVEAARPASPPPAATPSSPRRRPAWP